MVEYSFATLNTYGKTEKDLPKIIGSFDFVLSQYPIKQITKAFQTYLSVGPSTMPVPSDIVNIINPPKVWCRDKYLDIKRQIENDVYVTQEEREYCNDYLNRHQKATG